MKHVKSLDALRGLAVLAVVKEHWGLPINNPEIKRFIWDFTPGGGEGVYTFFVLSGFLITSILLEARDENHTTRHRLLSVRNFVFRRIFRIFPIYYITIAYLFAFFPEFRSTVAWPLTYSVNIYSIIHQKFFPLLGHAWTLSIEEQFYLIWPWLVIFIRRKYLKHLFIGAIILGIISTYIHMQVQGLFDPMYPFDCFDSFGIGAIYAYVRQNKGWTTRFEWWLKRIFPFALFMWAYWKYTGHYYMTWYQGWSIKTVISILALWLIMKALNAHEGKFKKYFWENRFLVFIGAISYGMYLYHPFVLFINKGFIAFINDRIVHNPFWHDFFLNSYFIYLFDFSMLVLLCWFSYTVIEKPIMKLKKYFQYET